MAPPEEKDEASSAVQTRSKRVRRDSREESPGGGDAVGHNVGDGADGEPLKKRKKNKKRKVNQACVYCRRSHMTCDLFRPCSRCVHRFIGHLCHDEPAEPRAKRSSKGTNQAALRGDHKLDEDADSEIGEDDSDDNGSETGVEPSKNGAAAANSQPVAGQPGQPYMQANQGAAVPYYGLRTDGDGVATDIDPALRNSMSIDTSQSPMSVQRPQGFMPDHRNASVSYYGLRPTTGPGFVNPDSSSRGNMEDNSSQDQYPMYQNQAYIQSYGDVGTDYSGIAQPIPMSSTRFEPMASNQFQPPGPSSASTQAFPSVDWSDAGVQTHLQDMRHLDPNHMFNTSEALHEYNLLDNFLSHSLIDDGVVYGPEEAHVYSNLDPQLRESTVGALAQNITSQAYAAGNHAQLANAPPAMSQLQAGQEISRPSSALPIDPRLRDHFYMTAADPAGHASAEDRLHKLLRAKYEAGMLRPFNYVKGYARMNRYLSENVSQQSQLRIMRQLDRFRPKFREAMHTLTDIQLVLVEMWFERSLMEYDRVFASMAIPACLWRRTGEIFRGNREMAELLDVPLDRLRDGQLAIHDVIAEDSLVSYWEKFAAIAFDQSQKAILTSCALKKGPLPSRRVSSKTPVRRPTTRPADTLNCCFSFTIRRDTHNM